MLNRFLITLLCSAASECSNQRGVPVPHAEVLESLISKYVQNQDYTGAVFDYLKGNKPNTKDNLDISVLDSNNVNKLIQLAKRRYMTRRGRESKSHPLYYEQGKYNKDGNAIIKTCMDMMKQSIYATRYRMQDTRRFRKIMTNDISYNIGIFYGALMQISLKLNSLFASMKKLKQYTHFMWFLVIYEKILAGNVDIHNMVDRIFYLNDIYIKRMKGNRDLQIAPTIPPSTMSTKRRQKYRRSTVTRRDPALEHTGKMDAPDFVPESKETKATTKPDSQEPTEAVEDDDNDTEERTHQETDEDRDKDKEKDGKSGDDENKKQNATDNSTAQKPADEVAENPDGADVEDQTGGPQDDNDDGGNSGTPAGGDAKNNEEHNNDDDNANNAATEAENPVIDATEDNAEKRFLRRPPDEENRYKYKRYKDRKNPG